MHTGKPPPGGEVEEMSKVVSDIVVLSSPTRQRGNGKPAVVVLFNYVIGWWIPEYVELRQIIDRLVEVEGKAKVEKALNIKIKEVI